MQLTCRAHSDRNRSVGPESARRPQADRELSHAAEAAAAGGLSRLHDQAEHLWLVGRRVARHSRYCRTSAASARLSSGGGPLQADRHQLYRIGISPGAGGVLPERGGPRPVRRTGGSSGRSRRGCCPAPASISSIFAPAPLLAWSADIPAHRPAAARQGRRRVRRGGAQRSGPTIPRLASSCWGRSTRATVPRSARPRLDFWVSRRHRRVSRHRPTTCVRSSPRRAPSYCPPIAKDCRARCSRPRRWRGR